MSPSPFAADALIVVDVQTAFVSGPNAVPAAAAIVPAINGLLSRARAADALIVHLQNDGPAGASDEPGTPGWQLFLPVLDGPHESVIRKTEDDGFAGTNLGTLLTEHGAHRLAICGVASEMCVSATARTALRRGFNVLLPHDAHGTYDIPDAPGISPLIPASYVSRVAEWALGDKLTLAPRAADITFT
jgi:nicotinamidase-related amidase